MVPMSQPASPHTQRSVAGMIGAMIVAVVVAGGWYLLGRPNEDVRPVPSVDWSAQVRAGRADQKLLTFAPPRLLPGWRANGALYSTGTDPHWHLGLLTDQGKYIGVDEGPTSVKDLVEQYVDPDAVQGADVRIGDRTWQSWTDRGGDYALTWSLRSGTVPTESVVVVGSASQGSVIAFVKTLTTAP